MAGIDHDEQQALAIETKASAVLVMSGAGTGKSTVTLRRVQHLLDSGVSPSKITVTSLTNAEAARISVLFPEIESTTVARMIHQQYQLAHPTHRLSTVDTIVNSIEAICPTESIAASLRQHLISTARFRKNAMTELQNLVRASHDDVIAILDIIGQTSMEIELVVCEAMDAPPASNPRPGESHLIVTDAQDQSLIELSFLIKSSVREDRDLYFVGDPRQTLYQFRGASTSSLTALHDSGLFTTFELLTDHRSDPASLITDSREVKRISLLSRDINQFVTDPAITEYVDDCLDRQEQIAFLVHTRSHAESAERTIRQMWPRSTVSNLLPKRAYATSMFSRFVSQRWESIAKAGPRQAISLIVDAISHDIEHAPLGDKSRILAALAAWQNQSNELVRKWESLGSDQRADSGEVLLQLRDLMLDHEIRCNEIELFSLAEKNSLRPVETTDFVVSTVHSAKGLEFDNVVLILRDYADPDEEHACLLHVGTTRARKSQYALLYGSPHDRPRS